MPIPSKLPTTLTTGSTGHIANTNAVHAAVNELTMLRRSTRVGDYVLALADSGEVIEFDAINPVTLTVPAHATLAFPLGTVIMVCQYGTGSVRVAPAAGVTLRTASSLTTRTRYAEISLRKRASNEWIVSGDLA